LNKCITKVVGAPADYTIVSAEGALIDCTSHVLINFNFTRHFSILQIT
jgi:hypothetical protein